MLTVTTVGIFMSSLDASIVVSTPFATLVMSFVLPYASLSTIIGGGTPSAAEPGLLMLTLRSSFVVFAGFNYLAVAFSPLRGSSRRWAAPILEED